MAVNPYELQRQRIGRQTEATGQQENEALKRRMARMGGLNSGAYLKASERLSGQQEQNKQNALEGVDIQEAQATEQKAETERGRQFSREERIGSQDFSAGEALKGRTFATGERLSAQDFASLEADKGRKFTTGEREAMQQYATGERLSGQDFANKTRAESQDWQSKESALGRNLQSSQFDKQFGLAERQFTEDQGVTRFNEIIATKQAGLDPNTIATWYQMMFGGGGNNGGNRTTYSRTELEGAGIDPRKVPLSQIKAPPRIKQTNR